MVTMFHEFGHLVHHVLGGDQEWVRFSGVATEWDFVEAPSQMLEEWAWDAAVLQTFATNAAGEPIPTELVAKMRRADDFGKGYQARTQMFYAAVSYRLHTAAHRRSDQPGPGPADVVRPDRAARRQPLPRRRSVIWSATRRRTTPTCGAWSSPRTCSPPSTCRTCSSRAPPAATGTACWRRVAVATPPTWWPTSSVDRTTPRPSGAGSNR